MGNKKQSIKNSSRLLLMAFAFFSATAHAQSGYTVKGTIVDSNGDPVIGASITLDNKKGSGVISDLDGVFVLKVPGNTVLTVSFIGMEPQKVKVTSGKPLKIVLQEQGQQLDEVVVVGYGTQKKASVVGAITQTTGKVLERAGGVSNVGAALTGNLPGWEVYP